MRPIRRIVMLLPLLLVAGCSTMKPSDFARAASRARPVRLLRSAKTRAWGSSKAAQASLRQFTVDIPGAVEGDRLT